VTTLYNKRPNFWIKSRNTPQSGIIFLKKRLNFIMKYNKYLKSNIMKKKIIQRIKKAATLLQKQAVLVLNKIKRKYQKLALYYLVVDHLYYMRVDYARVYWLEILSLIHD
jgi:hypothetical protein